MTDKENRTEEATPKRLRDARKKGQTAKSPDLNSAAAFTIFVLLTGTLGQYLFNNSLIYMKQSLENGYSSYISGAGTRTLFINNLAQYGLLLLPFAMIAAATGVAANLVQTGFIFTLETIKPDFKRMNPIEGLKNILSKEALFKLIKNLLKLSLVLYMAYKNMTGSMQQILNSGSIGTEKLYGFLLKFSKALSMDIAVMMLILAVVDYIFQRMDYKKNLRMSKQEIKDEYKEMEGDPQIKSLRQQRQRQLAMSRMMTDVKTSTVVVTNPTHIAVALRYDGTKDKAPLLTAKGADYIANKIKEEAKKHGVPIIENKTLARTMYKKVEIGDYIPVDLYKAIAEILAIVYQMREKNKHRI